ncbi:MAG: hypothetical protein IKX42_10675 [Fibrobacter sp.]|nr:hypothetical protein [Fibrobacter sp.]
MVPLKPNDMDIDPSMFPKIMRPLIKMGSSAVLFACSPMAIPFALLGSIYSEVKEQNTQKMLETLQRKFDELESCNLVSQEYLHSEHYVHLMVDILRRVYAFNSIQKKSCIAEIYKCVLQNKLIYDNSEEKMFIEFVEKINASEIMLLDFMSKHEDALQTIDSWPNFYNLYSKECGAPLLEKYKFKFFASQLEQMGLVYCSDLDGYDNHHQVLATGESKESSAGVTPMGKDFLIYLKSDF